MGDRRRSSGVGRGIWTESARLAGRVGDGVILQFADPDLIAWCVCFVEKGREAAGRDPAKLKIMSAAPVWVSDDLKVGRDHVRWFPALVSNHVVDLVSRYKPEELPPALTSYVRDRESTIIFTIAKSTAATRIRVR